MSTYLQLGHESWSLLDERDAGKFAGVVLSPVNDGPDYVAERLARLKARREQLEVILDPQLYNPAAERGKLSEWPFYSTEFETADHHDDAWWVARGTDVAAIAANLGVEAICSPAMLPQVFSDDYYRFVVDVGNETRERAASMGVETLLTAIVNLRDLLNPRRALDIASVLTDSDCERVYLTVLSDGVQQREPLKDGAGLSSVIHLVRLLSESLRVHVAFCAHDMLLWKAAGASDVSTGKWMNVRRFSPGRWREEDAQGRQIPYWNEPQLLTLLRDQDHLRLFNAGWYAGYDFDANSPAGQMHELLTSGSGKPWLKLSWLQYLRWFSSTEANLADPSIAERLLVDSDNKWAEVEALRIPMVDRFNDGTHTRIWLGSLREGLARSY
jgi:hypothetical protein